MGLLSALYGLGLSWKRFFCRHPERLPAKVISMGNLTLGGTGKTPAVAALAREAQKRGYRVCILTRGYKGKAKGISFVSKGDGPLLTPADAGDEAFFMAETLKGVTIIKGRDRFRAGMRAFENVRPVPENHHAPPLFILDDGFQHWKLFRDVDVLLIDAMNPFGNERLFPEGPLREPMAEIRRAHIMVITKADMAEEGVIRALNEKLRQYNREAPIFTASHKPAGLINGRGQERELSTLRNKSIYAFSGIANPVHFSATLMSAHARVERFREFRDHHHYIQKDIDKIREDAQGLEIVTTEKDLVKIRELDCPQGLWALKIDFSAENEFYDHLFSTLE